MRRLTVTLSDKTYNILECISSKTGIRKSRLIEMIIVDKKSLEEIELEYIIKEVKVRNTWHSWEDVKEELLV